MPGRGPRGSSGPGIRERDLGVRGASRGDANDYCQHFVDTGQRPQNFLRDVHLVSGFHILSVAAIPAHEQRNCVSVLLCAPILLSTWISRLVN